MAGLVQRIDPGNSVAPTAAIVSSATDPLRCRKAGEAGPDYAENKLSYHKLVRKFEWSRRQQMAIRAGFR